MRFAALMLALTGCAPAFEGGGAPAPEAAGWLAEPLDCATAEGRRLALAFAEDGRWSASGDGAMRGRWSLSDSGVLSLSADGRPIAGRYRLLRSAYGRALVPLTPLGPFAELGDPRRPNAGRLSCV
jgi:hypothetical protein